MDMWNRSAWTSSLVERVVPNALDVQPRTASLSALGTTRSTLWVYKHKSRPY